jgi:CRISPR system Cascade subunit CasD
MATLLLRYSAPLAAFGHTARFDHRPSAPTPTLSGIQGLIAAAAGVGRATPWPEWIAALHLAIRVEHAGRLMTDYHTVNQPPARNYRWLDGQRKVKPRALKQGKVEPQHVSYSGDRGRALVLANADGARASFDTFVSRRGYVADATFLIAVADPTGNIDRFLNSPTWAIYAGRKSCPLTEPLILGSTPKSPEQAVATTPTVAHPSEGDGNQTLTRQALLFTQVAGQTQTPEDRNDRAAGFKRYRPQRRWHTQVAVPVAVDWFSVIDDLSAGGPS